MANSCSSSKFLLALIALSIAEKPPSVLVDADATDPSAIGNATAALASLVVDLQRDLPPIRQSQPQTPPFQFIVHARYNPEHLTVLNIVPGLICMILIFSTLFVDDFVDHEGARTGHDGKPAGDAGAAA